MINRSAFEELVKTSEITEKQNGVETIFHRTLLEIQVTQARSVNLPLPKNFDMDKECKRNALHELHHYFYGDLYHDLREIRQELKAGSLSGQQASRLIDKLLFEMEK